MTLVFSQSLWVYTSHPSLRGFSLCGRRSVRAWLLCPKEHDRRTGHGTGSGVYRTGGETLDD